MNPYTHQKVIGTKEKRILNRKFVMGFYKMRTSVLHYYMNKENTVKCKGNITVCILREMYEFGRQKQNSIVGGSHIKFNWKIIMKTFQSHGTVTLLTLGLRRLFF